MKTDEERGPFAAWLRREVRARKWKESEARTRFEAAAPGVSFSSYRDLEAGNRPPTKDQRRGIEAVLGRIPEFEPVPATDQASVVTAIAAQTEVLRQLVEETRLSRVAQETAAEALGELAGLVARALRRGDTPAEPELADLVGTQR